jgi:hypothetical protein
LGKIGVDEFLTVIVEFEFVEFSGLGAVFVGEGRVDTTDEIFDVLFAGIIYTDGTIA